MNEWMILCGLLVWSFLGLHRVMRSDDAGTIGVVSAVVLGPLVFLMWAVLWLSKVHVTIKKRGA